MSGAAPEFSRPLALDRLGSRPLSEHLVASAGECGALAARFDVLALDDVRAEVTVTAHDRGRLVSVTGRITATVVQGCVVSGQPVRQAVAEDFAAGFVPAGQPDPAMAVDLDPDDDLFRDPEPIDGRTLDLGEVVAQYLCLALDPYPRAEGAALPDTAAPDTGEPDAGGPETGSPFAVLSRLKDRS